MRCIMSRVLDVQGAKTELEKQFHLLFSLPATGKCSNIVQVIVQVKKNEGGEIVVSPILVFFFYTTKVTGKREERQFWCSYSSPSPSTAVTILSARGKAVGTLNHFAIGEAAGTANHFAITRHQAQERTYPPYLLSALLCILPLACLPVILVSM